VGNGGTVVVQRRHAAILVRSADFTDDSVGSRASCAAHLAAGYVVDGSYLVGSVATLCDMP